jgi:16S rRNA processing protein RimM
MNTPSEIYLVVGEILKPWGYHGEVKVKIITDFPNRLVKHKTVYLGEQARAFQVERARLHSGYAILKLAGYDTAEAVAKLRGELVRIPADQAAKLKKGQYFHHQIIGLDVVTAEGDPVGTVAEILETGANDVYVVRTPTGGEVLIPAIKSVIQKIDLDTHTLTVQLLPGLIE